MSPRLKQQRIGSPGPGTCGCNAQAAADDGPGSAVEDPAADPAVAVEDPNIWSRTAAAAVDDPAGCSGRGSTSSSLGPGMSLHKSSKSTSIAAANVMCTERYVETDAAHHLERNGYGSPIPPTFLAKRV